MTTKDPDAMRETPVADELDKQLLADGTDPVRTRFIVEAVRTLERRLAALEGWQDRLVTLCRKTPGPCVCGAHLTPVDEPLPAAESDAKTPEPAERCAACNGPLVYPIARLTHDLEFPGAVVCYPCFQLPQQLRTNMLRRCGECNGWGHRIDTVRGTEPCPACNGTGRKPQPAENRCPDCGYPAHKGGCGFGGVVGRLGDVPQPAAEGSGEQAGPGGALSALGIVQEDRDVWKQRALVAESKIGGESNYELRQELNRALAEVEVIRTERDRLARELQAEKGRLDEIEDALIGDDADMRVKRGCTAADAVRAVIAERDAARRELEEERADHVAARAELQRSYVLNDEAVRQALEARTERDRIARELESAQGRAFELSTELGKCRQSMAASEEAVRRLEAERDRLARELGVIPVGGEPPL